MTPSVAALDSESVAYDPGSWILHFQRLLEVRGLYKLPVFVVIHVVMK